MTVMAVCLATVASSILTIGRPLPVYAAAPFDAVAVAVGRSGDTRVLQVGGDGVSNSSPIVVAPYQNGPATAATVKIQRWIFEKRPPGEGLPDFAYRVKNPATGKCLDRGGTSTANGAPIILYTCNNGANQTWYMNRTPAEGGVRFRNNFDHRCIDVPGGSLANNVALKAWNCSTSPDGWNQLWRKKTGPVECMRRTSLWAAVAQVCTQTYPVAGVMASWANIPVAISYRDPRSWPATNEAQTFINATVLNSQGQQYGAIEMGWRAVHSGVNPGGTTYTAYWTEWGDAGEEYHAIPSLDPLGSPNWSNVADGQQHTYLMLGAGIAGQWDLSYDYNPVATTRRQAGGRAGETTTGYRARYPDALRHNEFNFRTQMLDINGFWFRPRQVQTATGNTKECGSWPIWEDYTGAWGDNLPPYCVGAGRTFVGAAATPDVGIFTVEKPAPAAAAPAANASTGHMGDEPRTSADSPVLNGVDQRELAACMAQQADSCLDRVDGLRACVEARLVCNRAATPRTAARQPDQRRSALTAASARGMVGKYLQAADSAVAKSGGVVAKTATVMTAAELRRDLPDAPIPQAVSGELPVYLLTGDDLVKSNQPGVEKSFSGWLAVIDGQSGIPLYWRLGDIR